MFIADRYQNIIEKENETITEEMIEKLESMLTEYEVKHFFSLPIESKDGIAVNQDCILSIAYDSKDNVKFNLVYALWCKVYRKISDTRIINGLKRLDDDWQKRGNKNH